MSSKFIRWSLAFAIIAAFTSLSVSCKEKESEGEWYRSDPSQYTRYLDPRKDEVAIWLQSRPTSENPIDYLNPDPDGLVSSPVSYDEWLDKADGIVSIEDVLIDFYVNYDGIATPEDIFKFLGEFGTFRSVPVLIEALGDNDLDYSARILAAHAIGKIGDPKVFEQMLDIYLLPDEEDEDDTYATGFKDSILEAMIEIGDPRAIPLVTNELVKRPESKYLKSGLEVLEKKKPEFVVGWILRWHLDNKAEHPKRLPPYRSRKEWARFGRMIPGIEAELQRLYKDKNTTVNSYSILYAIGEVGTNESVPFLVEATINDNIHDSEARLAGVYALGKIGTLESQRGLLKIVRTDKRCDVLLDVEVSPDALYLLVTTKNKFSEMTPAIETAFEDFKDHPMISPKLFDLLEKRCTNNWNK